ncbi:hypothetical protein HBI56_095600 [Parastagonospora nodorum]|uniref:Uncharacterized protein n=1 Tax=Phaeosphaeria nodorum (strain SN15 / ATCC MYA-4574 / FGSC 10173) TaxID=321614 RepID=A0A7U2F3Z8_PHANO|nr:hypothetical protein HBH56_090920 [Parastagonospora nodorum]QRC98261.1 hypothetical protein JI435_303140 [Parastagonospora nodorum SN15]KAH3936353.1 hypothetical protein HBH54_025560 [Parastagonospora nodorum]KAH3945541.1 hypothetical protein HBH53_142660 [Parastagonospora nodorum]KAH3966656.1 hypothetical protein HBH51_142680 [Parastagonospora nodorum]
MSKLALDCRKFSRICQTQTDFRGSSHAIQTRHASNGPSTPSQEMTVAACWITDPYISCSITMLTVQASRLTSTLCDCNLSVLRARLTG